jgi:hypothetical protein
MNKEISVTDAIRLTGYSAQQLYNLLRAEKIKARQAETGRKVFTIDRASLVLYAEKHGHRVNR